MSRNETHISNLPPKPYSRLVGREAYVNQIMHALHDPNHLIIAIEGIGGVGKTALALEVAEQCLIGHIFDVVIWQYASRPDLSTSGTIERPQSFAFDDLLVSIAIQLDLRELLQVSSTEREHRIGALMHSERALLVLDGLDIAPQFQKDVIDRLIWLLNPSKALLTSRHRFEGDIYRIHLTGFTTEEALAFVRQEARERGLNHVLGASASELEYIAHASAFLPLALKLAVSELGRMPVEMVVRRLLAAPSAEIGDLYDFLFTKAWQMISAEGKQVLIALSTFLPSTSATLEAIEAVSNLDRGIVLQSLDELYRLSLVEKDETTSKGYLRYYLHRLTHRFIATVVTREQQSLEGTAD